MKELCVDDDIRVRNKNGIENESCQQQCTIGTSPTFKQTLKRGKPSTPQQQRTPYTITSSTLIDSLTAREQRDALTPPAMSAKESGLSPKCSLFGTQSDDSLTVMSFSDVQPLLYQTENDICETEIKKCSVCGTCEDLVSLPITQKGYRERG